MAPGLPSHLDHLQPPTRWKKISTFLLSQLNFYRVHLLVFTFVPFILSGVMYGINTAYKIEYIDCLFNCMSAMTVTGLQTVNLSQMSAMQQVLLFLQMIIGSPVFVSLLIIMVRQHFFRTTFRNAIREKERKKSLSLSKTISRVVPSQPFSNIKRRFSMSPVTEKKAAEAGYPNAARTAGILEESNGNGVAPRGSEQSSDKSTQVPYELPVEPATRASLSSKKKSKKIKISKDMIKRVDGGGMGRVNPMGWYEREHDDSGTTPESSEQTYTSPAIATIRAEHQNEGVSPSRRTSESRPTEQPSTKAESDHEPERLSLKREARVGEDTEEAIDDDDIEEHPLPPPRVQTPEEMSPTEHPSDKVPYAGRALADDAFPRSRTIAFDEAEDGNPHDHRPYSSARDPGLPRTATLRATESRLPRTGTIQSSYPPTFALRPTISRTGDTRLQDFGGFPTPLALGKSLMQRFFPRTSTNFARTMSMPRTNTIGGRGSLAPGGEPVGKEVPYISFSAVVGRNSHFKDLTEEQMDELGGVEYRALRALLVIVGAYFFFVQFLCGVIIWPYISAGGRYDSVFQDQYQVITIGWYSMFQSVSAFSNTGMSLVDTSMLPFQTAYLEIVLLILLILAGNTAFPIFLRLIVWTVYKLCPKRSKLRETLKFLLDHPRRCFIYLFPSTQTWVLVIVLFCLTMIDWVSFLVLDIGTEAIEAIPVNTRVAVGLLQACAVRAAGFGIVPLAALAPAVKVLYVIMMYVAVYPIALSVRSTNVYEERSLGLFNEDDELVMNDEDKGAQAVARYVGWHARRQLAFDIWWLAFALWLICIIERGQLNDVNATWFDIFTIIFELVSAYGTVGLSLGLPYDNYSLSGAFSTLGKLVVVAVMLRGRHRGLPVAIDRAVMLPKDFTAAEEAALNEEQSRRMSRRGSQLIGDDFFPGGPGLRRGSTSAFTTSRRESSPLSSPPITSNAHPRRSASFSDYAPGSPQTGGLQFTLPRTSHERGRVQVPPSTSKSGAGPLSPVKESTLSRPNTIDPRP